MSLAMVDQVARTILYEGYILYPYRASAVKNQQRFNFGVIYPPAANAVSAGMDPCRMQTECLVTMDRGATLDVRVRFLHLLSRQIGRLETPELDWPEDREPAYTVVPTLEIGGRIYPTWQESVEREVSLPGLCLNEMLHRPRVQPFLFPNSRTLEPLRAPNNDVVGVAIRHHEEITGTVELAVEELAGGLLKVRVTISNQTPLDSAAWLVRDDTMMRSFLSAHTILEIRDGQFISLLEPPDEFSAAAANCQNIGTWPVLVGQPGQRHTMLSSPIILYDYPEIAPESSGDFFDGTEMDEMLALRIMTLTDEEKREMRGLDERTHELLERTETLPQEQFMKLHGAVRGLRPIERLVP